VASLLSVNVGLVRKAPYANLGHSGMDKRPVTGRVAARPLGLDGDEVGDTKHHGGADQAVYAFAREQLDWWEVQLGRELPDGAFGENLTTRGVDCTNAVIGERWRVGSVELEVCQPRFPCFKLGLRSGNPGMLKRFTRAERPGAYLRIVAEGEIGAGDVIDVRDRPAHGVTIALVARAVTIDHALLARAAAAAELPADLSSWMLERAA
jgi:MOSC domain-containing protein YiiM